MSEEYAFGVCGVFCEMCPTGNGRISELAKELLHLTSGNYEWAEDGVDFRFADVRKGLEWFARAECPTCLKIEEPWCDVLKCGKIVDKELESCLECGEIYECPATEYHRGRYPYVLQHHEHVKKVGLERHWKEQRERTRKGVCLIDIREY
ncbi:MAG: hypothetical protein AYK23_05635 [Candidatus Proteinoplasmatales archaeon SG8-5]|nr:MAG: hypothetical protein AYK23_05635 [Candidatus Proteinoplasmatales archaeon SG8-5]